VTINHIISAIKSFFNYLNDVEVVTTNVASRVQRPRLQRTIRKAPTADHVAVILSEAKSLRHQAMLEILVDCGLRRAELVTIRISNIDAENRLLRVTGKGRKERQVPISPAVVNIVSSQVNDLRSTGYDGDWLFPGQDPAGHVTADSIHSYLERLCRKLDIPRISPHQLRHYFATQMLSSGANLKVTAAILGHAQASTTADIYWHILDQKELVEQHARFSPLRECG
jgi:site-specific recombinase XerD